MNYIKYAAITSGLVLSLAFVLPVSAAPNTNDCIAEFANFDLDYEYGFERFGGDQYSQVASNVDVNYDGFISPDERIVACTKDVLKTQKSMN